MSNYEQRILKFLNQNNDLNPDRAPTITDMMTKLNISISDISDSLKNLLANGLVARRMNSIGIECWSPAQAAAPLSNSIPAQSNPTPPQNIPLTPKPTIAPSVNFMGGPIDKPVARPEAVPSAPKPGPVAVQHFSLVDKASLETQTFPAMSLLQPKDEISAQPKQPSQTFSNEFKSGTPSLSLVTFVIGLILAIGLSVGISITLTANQIGKLQRTIADQKASANTSAALVEFQSRTKSHISELETQVKLLKTQLAAFPAPGDSVKLEAPVTETKPTVAKAALTSPKGKVPKKPVPAKIVKTTKAVKPPPASVKPTAAKMKKEKVATNKNTHSEKSESTSASYDPESKTIPSESSSPSYDAGPNVPAPPGLDQELPPPSP